MVRRKKREEEEERIPKVESEWSSYAAGTIDRCSEMLVVGDRSTVINGSSYSMHFS